MSEENNRSESLLEAWLQLSMTLWNERFVSYMTYNEALICRLLYKQRLQNPDNPSLTLMQLSKMTGILKSQMNKTLASLESDGSISRTRSQKDKRIIFITLNGSMIDLYRREHENVMNIVNQVANTLGDENTASAIEIFDKISKIISKIYSEREKD